MRRLAAVLLALGVGAASGCAGAERAHADDTADALRAQLAKERKAHRVERRSLALRIRRITRARPAPVSHAIRLAAHVYGVPEGEMRSVGRCESGLSATAQHPGSRASGVMQFLPSTWRRTSFGRAGFSVWDPYANVLAAASIVSREGWRQWVCRP